MIAGRRRWIERLKAEGKKIPGGRKPGSRIATKPATPVRTRADIRKMSPEEIIAAGREALKQLQELLERTGRLIG
jgi:hypothetical protein